MFADTPGIYKAGTALSGRMLRTAESTAKDVELILFVHDGHKGVSEEDIALMKHYQTIGVPMLVAYTKTDIMPAENIPQDVKTLYEGGIACDVYPVSLGRGGGSKNSAARSSRHSPRASRSSPKTSYPTRASGSCSARSCAKRSF